MDTNDLQEITQILTEFASHEILRSGSGSA